MNATKLRNVPFYAKTSEGDFYVGSTKNDIGGVDIGRDADIHSRNTNKKKRQVSEGWGVDLPLRQGKRRL